MDSRGGWIAEKQCFNFVEMERRRGSIVEKEVSQYKGQMIIFTFNLVSEMLQFPDMILAVALIEQAFLDLSNLINSRNIMKASKAGARTEDKGKHLFA